MNPITQLSKTGEVAELIGVDQFDGLSLGKCGYEAVATAVCSSKPGQTNSATTASVRAMAHLDYQKWAGPDITSNPAGMDQAQCHADLGSHNLKYIDTSTDWNTIRAWLKYGYFVIVCIQESQVYDYGIKNCPYPWLTSGINHIILVSGVGSQANTMKFRDSANIIPPNNLRPMPREYDVSQIGPYWAVVVVPAWMPVPPAGFNPLDNPIVTPPPVVAGTGGTAQLKATADDKQVWQVVVKNAPCIDTHGIPQSWLQYRWAKGGLNFGSPLEAEHTVIRGGTAYIEQQFSCARASYNTKTGVCVWYDSRGKVPA